MKYATIKLEGKRNRSRTRSIESSGGWWVQFGSDVLICSTAERWQGLIDGLGAAARNVTDTEGDVKKGDMHLVVQKGRTFQIENPDARLLFDKGRYLVVEMPRAEARKLAGRTDPCFHIEPLKENSVVFEERLPGARAVRAAEARVQDVVAAVQQATFEAAIAHLVSFRTRLSTSPEYTEAAEWARGQFEALGLTTTLMPVAVGAGQSSNVIGTLAGTGGTERGAVLVVAHLDSINHPGGPSALAPGADDNASGSAGALTLAKSMAGRSFAHDLIFILFGGEEQGLNGSEQYVAGLSQVERDRIRAVLNMDMISSVNAKPPAVLLEGAALSQQVIEGLATAAAQFTGLTVQVSLNPFASDHVPFIQAGIPAVLTIEGADSANDAIHTANDTLDRIDTGFATDILRMNAGYLAATAEVSEQPQPQPAGCGCGTPQVDPGIMREVNALSAHYQALFALYARLSRDGPIQRADYTNWQSARDAYDTLFTGTGFRPPGAH